MRHAGIAVAGAIVLTLLCSPAVAGADVPPQSTAMIQKVNSMRRANGLPVLQASEALVSSSRSYARYMLKTDYFGHLASIRAGGSFQLLGETLAWHSGWRARVAYTFARWMASPSHRAVLMNPVYRFMGAGRARGRMGARRATAWVAQFGGQPARPPVPLGG
jgi:uncharacterized protein YkwD